MGGAKKLSAAEKAAAKANKLAEANDENRKSNEVGVSGGYIVVILH